MNSSKLIKELRMMLKEMPAQRFWAIWLLGLLYFSARFLDVPIVVSWLSR
ncbi:hypothetical protein B0O95_10790 [Mycetohabitans endofungorum]|uniref:Uncharacterized protein n=1 Tax=Mycetohabitans endofungorum TaxID=417203 RepID=A0A2P5KA21_9BURK|nr:hypothetical protein B0O95_10790 [Mycetohabitans endofungorum]